MVVVTSAIDVSPDACSAPVVLGFRARGFGFAFGFAAASLVAAVSLVAAALVALFLGGLEALIVLPGPVGTRLLSSASSIALRPRSLMLMSASRLRAVANPRSAPMGTGAAREPDKDAPAVARLGWRGGESNRGGLEGMVTRRSRGDAGLCARGATWWLSRGEEDSTTMSYVAPAILHVAWTMRRHRGAARVEHVFVVDLAVCAGHRASVG